MYIEAREAKEEYCQKQIVITLDDDETILTFAQAEALAKYINEVIDEIIKESQSEKKRKG